VKNPRGNQKTAKVKPGEADATDVPGRRRAQAAWPTNHPQNPSIGTGVTNLADLAGWNGRSDVKVDVIFRNRYRQFFRHTNHRNFIAG
jgi:hypothetical protein